MGLLSFIRETRKVINIIFLSRICPINSHRPIQWSASSVIYTAHPTRSQVVGRHFSSSKQFVLPSPSNLIASSTLYDPPSVISVSQTDDWLFAYFPRKDGGEGTACIWNRGPQIDNWIVKECWYLDKAAGAVTATWLEQPRQVSASILTSKK